MLDRHTNMSLYIKSYFRTKLKYKDIQANNMAKKLYVHTLYINLVF